MLPHFPKLTSGKSKRVTVQRYTNPRQGRSQKRTIRAKIFSRGCTKWKSNEWKSRLDPPIQKFRNIYGAPNPFTFLSGWGERGDLDPKQDHCGNWTLKICMKNCQQHSLRGIQTTIIQTIYIHKAKFNFHAFGWTGREKYLIGFNNSLRNNNYKMLNTIRVC